MADHNLLGKNGENLAENYLRQKGYQVLERNWIYNKQEIDIIASIDEFIVFVEVKTRSTEIWGNPEEAVSDTKIKRIVNAADFYIKEHDIEKFARFDIIGIITNKQKTQIMHFEDAFFAPLN